MCNCYLPTCVCLCVYGKIDPHLFSSSSSSSSSSGHSRQKTHREMRTIQSGSRAHFFPSTNNNKYGGTTNEHFVVGCGCWYHTTPSLGRPHFALLSINSSVFIHARHRLLSLPPMVELVHGTISFHRIIWRDTVVPVGTTIPSIIHE